MQSEGNLAVSTKSNTETKTTQTSDQQLRPGQASLVQRYGKIGIPALKAALRYATPSKDVASSGAIRFDERFVERAA